MNIHGARRAGRRRRKAFRLWTGGEPQWAGRDGHIVSPRAQLVNAALWIQLIDYFLLMTYNFRSASAVVTVDDRTGMLPTVISYSRLAVFRPTR